MNVSSQIQALGRDPFDELDQALRLVRTYSHAIAEAVDVPGWDMNEVEGLMVKSDAASARVKVLLAETSAILAEAGL